MKLFGKNGGYRGTLSRPMERVLVSLYPNRRATQGELKKNFDDLLIRETLCLLEINGLIEVCDSVFTGYSPSKGCSTSIGNAG